jgi:hypothetical protein
MDKLKNKEETLSDSLEFLEKSKEASEDFRFNFACFVDSFKRYLIKSGNLKE